MSDLHRVIGRLEEFQEWAKAELTEIKSDVKNLNQFRWRMAGVAGVAATLLTVAIEVGKAMLK